jgi:hypothetical protein
MVVVEQADVVESECNDVDFYYFAADGLLYPTLQTQQTHTWPLFLVDDLHHCIASHFSARGRSSQVMKFCDFVNSYVIQVNMRSIDELEEIVTHAHTSLP